MCDLERLEGVPRSRTVAMLFDGRGATAYMTRAAIRDLAARLYEISDADPKDCFEVHFGLHFSNFDENEDHHSPSVRLDDELWETVDHLAREDHQRAVAAGDPDAILWHPGSLEMTIMHVSPEAVRKESECQRE